ncbi:MAG: DsbC family protein [Pseudomonadota bacterium]|nr:DsbC family protein [Pseudomonadota bacterium]
MSTRSSTDFRLAFAFAFASVALVFSCSVYAQEAQIRKSLAERLPTLPKIDEVQKSPVPGVWEVRYGGTEILYSDDKGEHIFIGGSLVDTKTRTDLTEARLQKLQAVDFDKLPVKDAFVIKQGSGARKMAVFVDPNCGYCKRFERDLATIKDVTIYTFLIPILGPDSVAKAKDIWCAKESPLVWRDWMINGVTPPRDATKGCDTAAIQRNLEFARQQRIAGTPAVFFADGTRKPGAIPAAAIEEMLVAAAKK